MWNFEVLGLCQTALKNVSFDIAFAVLGVLCSGLFYRKERKGRGALRKGFVGMVEP
jgi:hypothetical protein